jgi:RNA polymerase sigma-32 factor
MRITDYEPADRYIKSIKNIPKMDRETEFDLMVECCNSPTTEAQHKLILSQLYVVRCIAHRYRKYGIPMTDLIQCGNVGLVRAIHNLSRHKYVPTRTARLAVYTQYWISRAIRDCIMKDWNLVRLPDSDIFRKLFFRFDHYAALVSEGVCTQAEVDLIQSMVVGESSINDVMNDDTKTEFQQMMVDESPSVEVRLARQETIDLVREVYRKLSEREQYVIKNRWLNGDDPVGLLELGKSLNITKQGASLIEQKALKKMRHEISKRMKKDNYDYSDCALW